MKSIDKKNITTQKIVAPEQENDKFIPENNSFTLDELVNVFLYVHPSEFPEFKVEIKRRGCILLFPSPKKMIFNFIDPDTGENCIVDYLWNDVLEENNK